MKFLVLIFLILVNVSATDKTDCLTCLEGFSPVDLRTDSNTAFFSGSYSAPEPSCTMTPINFDESGKIFYDIRYFETISATTSWTPSAVTRFEQKETVQTCFECQEPDMEAKIPAGWTTRYDLYSNNSCGEKSGNIEACYAENGQLVREKKDCCVFSFCVTQKCSVPNTSFPAIAINEELLFMWDSLSDRSSECRDHNATVQKATLSCETTYRCVRQKNRKRPCRNEQVGSYVSPTAGVFHEDISLTGTEIYLHYQSANIEDTDIAHGWSLNIHHKLNGNYIYLGNGQKLNIEGLKKKENNATIVSLGGYTYIFDSNALHVKTIDSFTNKILYTFSYGVNKDLLSVTNKFGKTLTLHRDETNQVSSIRAPYGQITLLNIDENYDLTTLSYEDGSTYEFFYDAHFMSKEIEPNKNEFKHTFNTNGDVIEVVDAENGVWSFKKEDESSDIVTIVKKPAGDTIAYKDYYLQADMLNSETILPSGDIVYRSSHVDGNSVSTLACGVDITTTYTSQNDLVTNKPIIQSTLIQTPNGLTRKTLYAQNYTFDSNNTLLRRKNTATMNGKTESVVQDYNTSSIIITSPEGRTSSIVLNDNEQPTTIQVANFKPVIYKYNKNGQLTKMRQGTRNIVYRYDEYGNLHQKYNSQRNERTLFEYDLKGRLKKVTYPDTQTITFTYDANGNRTKLVTPSSANHMFSYNGVNKRSSMTSPLGYITNYTYDKQKRLTNITRASGKSVQQIYRDGRLYSIKYDGVSSYYSYTCADNIGSVVRTDENISYGYDGDLITSFTQSGTINQTINYAYNDDFLVKSMTYAGVTDDYTYDNDGLLTGSGTFTIKRDSVNGFVTDITDGVKHISKIYNRYGELKKQKDENFVVRLKYDKGRIAYKKEKMINYIPRKKRSGYRQQRVINEYNYTYDKRGRLTQVDENNQTVESYTYDANGNRISATVNGITTSASYTLDDNLEVYGNNTYSYDIDGNLIEKITPNGTTTYSYTAEGTLTKVVTPTNTIEYVLNPLGQRIAKKVDSTITEKYLWANLTTLLAIYDKDDNLIQRFNYTDQKMPISMTMNNETYYLHYNQVGTLKAISNQQHQIVKEITYDTFGNILKETNPNLTIPFGFAGGVHDRDTGLVHFGYREYDPYTGKWTAKDPIDFSGGDSNLYGYVLGDPVGFIDPEGLRGLSLIPVGIGLLTYTYNQLDDMWNGKNDLANLAICNAITDNYNYLIDQVDNITCMSDQDKTIYQLELNNRKQKAFTECFQAIGKNK